MTAAPNTAASERAETIATDCAALLARIRDACNEIIAREKEELHDIHDVNCVAAGWCLGAIAAAEELLELLDEERDACALPTPPARTARRPRAATRGTLRNNV